MAEQSLRYVTTMWVDLTAVALDFYRKALKVASNRIQFVGGFLNPNALDVMFALGNSLNYVFQIFALG